MSALQNFAFEGQLVRVIEIDGEPWFVGKDVCTALGIVNTNDAIGSLDADEKGVASTDPLSRGGSQTVVIISEPGVYRLVFRSRKPEAERFKRWLAHDVLPSIRKTGRYEAPGIESFDTGPLAALNIRIAMVREARAIFGPSRAAGLWKVLNLPDVPEAPSALSTGGEDGRACLYHLLSLCLNDGRTVEDALSDPIAAQDALLAAGLGLTRPAGAHEGWSLFVPNGYPPIDRHFAHTAWRNGGWRLALPLAGVRWKRASQRIGGEKRRGLALTIADLVP